jgi:hypothetical protein
MWAGEHTQPSYGSSFNNGSVHFDCIPVWFSPEPKRSNLFAGIYRESVQVVGARIFG